MANGYIWDPWENAVEPPQSLVDMLKDFISSSYRKAFNKQEDENLSDEIVTQTPLDSSDYFTGWALFNGRPQEVGVSGTLGDVCYYVEIPFRLFEGENWLGQPFFIGATNHLYNFGHSKYLDVYNAVNSNYYDWQYYIDTEWLTETSPTEYRYIINTRSANNVYCGVEYYTGAGGVISYEYNQFYSSYTLSGNRIVNDNATLRFGYNTRQYQVANTNDELRITSVSGSGGGADVGSDMLSVRCKSDVFVSTNNSNIINNIYNNTDNTEYHNTYTYNIDNTEYTVYYGDNYILMPSSNGLSYDDLRVILEPVIVDLQTNGNLDSDFYFPTFEDFKYVDRGSFYITPVKQIDKLPSAPDVADTVIDVSEPLSLLSDGFGALLSCFDSIGVTLTLTFTFLACLVINKLRGD